MKFGDKGAFTTSVFDTKKQHASSGTFADAGPGTHGEALFTITGMKDAKGKALGTVYGAYKISDGESKTFSFLETAMSLKQIKTLDDGLAADSYYTVGIACAASTRCDFSKADPSKKAQTPVIEYYDFLDESFF